MTEPEQKQPPFLQFDPEMRRLVLALGYLLFTGGVVFALVAIWPVISTFFSILSPFIVALVVAYIFNPIVNFVQLRLKLTRIGGVIVVNLLLLLIAVGFVAIVIPILSTQVKAAYIGTRATTEERFIPWATAMILDAPAEQNVALVNDFQSFYKARSENLEPPVDRAELESFLSEWEAVSPVKKKQKAEFVTHMTDWFDGETSDTLTLDRVQAHVDDLHNTAGQPQAITWDDFVERIDRYLAPQNLSSSQIVERALKSSQVQLAAKTAAEESAGFFAKAVGGVFNAIGTLFSSALFLSFVLIVSFYLLVDFSSLTGVIEVLCPDEYEERLFGMLKKIDVAVGGFIRGQLISASLVGLLAFIGLYALGLQQYALLIGFIAGIGNLIPYLGPILGATPAVLYMLFTSDFETFQERGIYVLITVGLFGLIQTIDGFIFQPKIVGQSAQLHPIAVIIALAFGAQFGIVGMIIAVPVMCILRTVWKEFFWDDREEEWRKTTGKKSLSDYTTKRKTKTKKAS